MTWQISTPAIILFVTTGLSLIIGWIAWNRRVLPGSLALCLLMIATAEWSFTSGLSASVMDQGAILLLAKLEYIGILSTPLLLLTFILRFLHLDRWITLRTAVLAAVLPVISFVLVLTNDRHRLIWKEIQYIDDQPVRLIIEHGPAYYAILAYLFAVIGLGMLLLIRRWRLESGGNRTRINVILVSVLIPVIASIFYSFGLNPLPGLDMVPITFFVSGVIVTFSLLRMKDINLLPVARENLVENLQDGVLVVDLNDHVADINLAAQEMIGIPADKIIKRHIRHLPDLWQAALRPSDGPSSAGREVIIPGDPPMILEVHTSALTDSEKLPSGRLIVMHDISEHRQAEEKLRLRAEELSMLNQISLAITAGLELDRVLKTLHEKCKAIIPSEVFYVALYDDITGLIEMPLYYEDTYSYPSPREINNRPGLTGFIITTRKTLYIPDTLNPQGECPIPPIRMGGTPSRSYVGIPLILRDKVIGVMSVQSFEPHAFNPEQIRLLETVAVEAAIAIENARLYGEVQRLAIIDELTDIYNYRGLIELGRREVERANRFEHPLALLFFDIDKFKNFNNLYSHSTGNIVLKEITLRCRSILRSVDVFTRYGGDEFVVLLPETTRDMALQVAERLRAEVAAARVNTRFGDLSVTISIGVAMLVPGDMDLDALIEIANRAEHRAKLKGDCVEVED